MKKLHYLYIIMAITSMFNTIKASDDKQLIPSGKSSERNKRKRSNHTEELCDAGLNLLVNAVEMQSQQVHALSEKKDGKSVEDDGKYRGPVFVRPPALMQRLTNQSMPPQPMIVQSHEQPGIGYMRPVLAGSLGRFPQVLSNRYSQRFTLSQQSSVSSQLKTAEPKIQQAVNEDKSLKELSKNICEENQECSLSSQQSTIRVLQDYSKKGTNDDEITCLECEVEKKYFDAKYKKYEDDPVGLELLRRILKVPGYSKDYNCPHIGQESNQDIIPQVSSQNIVLEKSAVKELDMSDDNHKRLKKGGKASKKQKPVHMTVDDEDESLSMEDELRKAREKDQSNGLILQ